MDSQNPSDFYGKFVARSFFPPLYFHPKKVAGLYPNSKRNPE